MNENSFISRIYTRHHKSLRRFLQVKLTSKEDVEDLLQETFLRAYQKSQQETIEQPRNWLFKVASRIVIDKARNKSNHLLCYNDSDEEPEFPDPSPSIEQQVSSKQDFSMLFDAVLALPPRCQQVFILRNFHYLSYNEIAKKLGITKSGVEKHVTKGLSLCEVYLKKHSREH